MEGLRCGLLHLLPSPFALWSADPLSPFRSEFTDSILSVHPSDVLDMPVDPNEPTYCLCHQVSYGEMIGCDNPDVSGPQRIMGKPCRAGWVFGFLSDIQSARL